MESIEKSVDNNAQLTIFTVKGSVPGEEIKNAISDFYEHGPITKNVLWDLSHAVLDNLSAEDVRQIVNVPKKSFELRLGGKTVLVAPDDLAYGLSRMYQTSSRPDGLPFEVQVFRDFEAAHKWLAETTP